MMCKRICSEYVYKLYVYIQSKNKPYFDFVSLTSRDLIWLQEIFRINRMLRDKFLIIINKFQDLLLYYYVIISILYLIKYIKKCKQSYKCPKATSGQIPINLIHLLTQPTELPI